MTSETNRIGALPMWAVVPLTLNCYSLLMTGQQTLFSAPQTATGNDDWYTPKWIFETLGLTFDIDVASPPEGIPWIPARRYYTMEDDGLAQPWKGLVWCNPPFSKLTPWAHKFIEHGNGIMLTPFGRSKWLSVVWDSSATMLNLPSDLKFQKPDGGWYSMSFGAVLWAMGEQAQDALTNLGKTR